MAEKTKMNSAKVERKQFKRKLKAAMVKASPSKHKQFLNQKSNKSPFFQR